MHKNSHQKSKKIHPPKPSTALRFRIDERGELRARVSASAGEFNLTPDMIHLLCLLQKGVAVGGLATKISSDFKQITAQLPQQAEIEELLKDLTDAQFVTSPDGSPSDALVGNADGFGDPWIQWAMLADAPRCRAYHRALAERVDRNSHVLDVGAGTGLLSLYSLEAGARCVEAIEETAVAKTLQKVKNSLPKSSKERLIIHNQNSADAVFSPAVTHVVSELFGNDPLQEGLIPTLRNVFSRLPSPRVQAIPEAVEVFAQCVEITEGPLRDRLQRLNDTELFSSEPWSDAIQTIRRIMQFDDVSFAHPVRHSDFTRTGEIHSAFRMELNPPPSEHTAAPAKKFKISIQRDLKCPTVLICFRAHLTKKITISNIPGASDQCDHWSPIVVPIMRSLKGREAIEVHVGVSNDWERIIAEIRDSQSTIIGARKS